MTFFRLFGYEKDFGRTGKKGLINWISLVNGIHEYLLEYIRGD